MITFSIINFVVRLLIGLIFGSTDSWLSYIDFSVYVSFFILAYYFGDNFNKQIEEKDSFRMFVFPAIIVAAEIATVGILSRLELWRIACELILIQALCFAIYWYRKRYKKK